MLVILGESASGKTTLLKAFVNENPQYHKIVTYTSRPRRKGEKDNVDYHFVSQDRFEELIKSDFFIEYTQYRGWYYGTAKDDCQSENAVLIVNPPGLRTLKRLNYDVTSVYLYVDRRSRLINLLARGDDIEEAYRRNITDVGQFSELSKEVDYVIDNTGFHMDEIQVLKCLDEILKVNSLNPQYLQESLFE